MHVSCPRNVMSCESGAASRPRHKLWVSHVGTRCGRAALGKQTSVLQRAPTPAPASQRALATKPFRKHTWDFRKGGDSGWERKEQGSVTLILTSFRPQTTRLHGSAASRHGALSCMTVTRLAEPGLLQGAVTWALASGGAARAKCAAHVSAGLLGGGQRVCLSDRGALPVERHTSLRFSLQRKCASC